MGNFVSNKQLNGLVAAHLREYVLFNRLVSHICESYLGSCRALNLDIKKKRIVIFETPLLLINSLKFYQILNNLILLALPIICISTLPQ